MVGRHPVRVDCGSDEGAEVAPVVQALPQPAYRGGLLAEVADEVAEASVASALDGLAHEPADVGCLAYGTALLHGGDVDGPDGQVARRAGGEVLKGGRYEAPDVSAVPRRQDRVSDGAA
ncbi:hypothetical protein ACFV5G_02125 [Streptomyces sp. NPDC059766]|uniref:hypothetical protein n=1 Tax=Streptomyces sp. NPDC059766 TaxID=3346940 RepID=UPI003659A092